MGRINDRRAIGAHEQKSNAKKSQAAGQMDLFAAITSAYAAAPDAQLDNADLYSAITRAADHNVRAQDAPVPIGRAGAPRSPLRRQIRWYQQTLKQLGVLEHAPGTRGAWRLTAQARQDLHPAGPSVKLVAFSTELGVAIWGRCEEVFPGLTESVALCITSPPYPLRKARAYGGPTAADYTDFLCRALESIVRTLVPGGSLVLNISNDIFEPGRPSRDLYAERLVLALHDRLGLALMDRIPWVNPSKPPAPTHWACVRKVQLVGTYEPVYWFTNDPDRVRADNRRVLEAHTARQEALHARGGERRRTVYGDGTCRVRPGSYGQATAGRLPRNVLTRGHTCSDSNAYRRHTQALGLPAHAAMQPTAIPDFFIRLLTDPGDLVVDPFGGTVKTGLAAERLGRRWLVAEQMGAYLRGAAELFRTSLGFRLSHNLMPPPIIEEHS